MARALPPAEGVQEAAACRAGTHTAAPTAWQPTVAALLACLGSRLAAAQCHPDDSGPPAASCSVWCSSGTCGG
ncbi:Uncharacterised protein [Chlamydia abortus]|nr:Uncharacterised protein [Chlamydia abortus]